MIKRRREGKKGFYSLYLGLLMNILIALVAASVTYMLLRIASNYYFTNIYVTPERQLERREEYLENLQKFAATGNLSSEDTDRIAEWAREHPYVYLMIYKDDQLFFTSDMEPEIKDETENGEENTDDKEDVTTDSDDGAEGEGTEDTSPEEGEDTKEPEADTESDGLLSTEDGSVEDKAEGESGETESEGSSDAGTGGGGTGGIGGSTGGSTGDSWLDGITDTNEVNREELMAEAQANGLYPIELSDGTLFAAVTEFSQNLYLNIFNIMAFAVAAVVLTLVLINYMRRVIARIKRLESDVTIVSHVNMNHRIVVEGKDEISKLSTDVETMRNSILLNLEREREAREANTELVTSISHDIRTPLTVLLGYLDMMKNRVAEDEVMKGYVAASEKTAMRLKELSDDMFKYSLAFGDAGKGISLEEYDARTLLEQLLAEHIVLLSENGYGLEYESDGATVAEGETVLTDAPNLMRIIDNVFSNLYKYADKSYPVVLAIKREKQRLILVCKNKIRTDSFEAESNGIGLKTCVRLGEFVAEKFSYANDGEYFTATLSLRIGNAKSNQK